MPRDLWAIEGKMGVMYKPIIEELRKRFPGERLEGLDEGGGASTFKKELMAPKLSGNIKVTTTDVRKLATVDAVVNVHGLVKRFGENRFHFVNSCFGGVAFSPCPQQALYQIVAVLKPGGIGVVTHAFSFAPKEFMEKLAKTLNISIIKQPKSYSLVFKKNQAKTA